MSVVIILAAIILFFNHWPAQAAHYAGELIGYMLLQVEECGEAWYVYPVNGQRYYLGRPADAFKIMKSLSLGVKHDFLAKTEIFPARLSGLILLDVEKNGEAYYIYPLDLKKYYLGRPADAWRLMGKLGIGITNAGLVNIPIGEVGELDQEPKLSGKILIDKVPFTAQAPYGNWQDQRLEDGCEEATALMAISCARGEELSREKANNIILKLSDYLQDKYHEYRDISPADAISWIYNDYFNYDKAALVKNITIDNIISELARGNLVVTPMNGQIMHNPYYTQPGPVRHMVLIRGYDPGTKEFITNDPGTKNGELYRYDAKVLYNAIRDYPTGYHELIKKIEKNMIVVWK